MKNAAAPINAKTSPPILNQNNSPRLSETGPATANPMGVIPPLRLMRMVNTRPCIWGGITACMLEKKVPLAMALNTANMKTQPTAARKSAGGMKLKVIMKTPLMTSEVMAVTTRLLNPPQAPRRMPPAIMPTPLADWSHPSSMAPPSKWFVTTNGSRLNAGLIRKLMSMDIPMMILRPFQLQTNTAPSFMSESMLLRPVASSAPRLG